MWEKEFAPYELAVNVKDLGFDGKCLGWYTVLENLVIKEGVELQDLHETNTLSPLWQQVEDWFLKEHKLYGIVIPTSTMHWTYKITTVTEDMVEAPPYKNVNGTDYPTYEDARKAMVKEMITML